jgi:hypothetical protein
MEEIILLGKVLNSFHDGLNKDHFKVLNTNESSPEIWWDSLGEAERNEVGLVAFHYHRFTPNYIWWTSEKFKDIKKPQKAHIKFALSKKDCEYYRIELGSLFMKSIK